MPLLGGKFLIIMNETTTKTTATTTNKQTNKNYIEGEEDLLEGCAIRREVSCGKLLGKSTQALSRVCSGKVSNNHLNPFLTMMIIIRIILHHHHHKVAHGKVL